MIDNRIVSHFKPEGNKINKCVYLILNKGNKVFLPELYKWTQNMIHCAICMR